MSRFDLLKSLVRAGADRATDRLAAVGPLKLVRRFVRELRDQRSLIDERSLTSAVAHGPGVRAASVTARAGRLRVDLSIGDEDLVFFAEPAGVRFASRGAKEIAWTIEPAPLARHRSVRDAVSALSGAVAHGVWSVAIGPLGEEPGGAIVDVDGPGRLRVDLRTVPAVRDASSKASVAMVFDVLDLERVEVEDGAMALRLRLPSLAR